MKILDPFGINISHDLFQEFLETAFFVSFYLKLYCNFIQFDERSNKKPPKFKIMTDDMVKNAVCKGYWEEINTSQIIAAKMAVVSSFRLF